MSDEKKPILRMKKPKTHEQVVKETLERVNAMTLKKKERDEEKAKAVEMVTEKQKRLDKTLEESYDAMERMAIELGTRLGWTNEQIQKYYNKHAKSRMAEFQQKQEDLNKERLAVGLPASDWVLPDIPH